MMDAKLVRSKSRMIAGVCQGLADYFKIDVVIVRVIFIILALGKGIGVIAYIILLIVMPEADGGTADEAKSDFKDKSNLKDEIKKGVNAKVEPLKKIEFSSPRVDLLAYILIAFGVIMLLNNLVPAFFSLDRVWPLFLVLIGLAILFSGRKKD